MKKTSLFAGLIAACLTLSSCFTTGTGAGTSTAGTDAGSILGSVLGSEAGGDILNSLLGGLLTKTLTEESLYGTWVYQSPEVRFESENLLAKAGGEVVAHGLNAKGEPWHVGITKPNLNNEGAQDELQDILAVTDICMATSGNYRNYYYEGTERRSHTIDPRTGYPVQHSVLSATVVSSSCMRADALATACMVLGAEQAIDMINRAEDAACYLIVAKNDSLTVISSQNWAEFIKK